MSSIQDSPRHRNFPNTPSNIKTSAATKQINAASSLEKIKLATEPDNGLTPSIIIGMAITILGGVIPSLVSWGTTMSLIFGGCCSNVRPSVFSLLTRAASSGWERYRLCEIGICFGNHCEVST